VYSAKEDVGSNFLFCTHVERRFQGYPPTLLESGKSAESEREVVFALGLIVEAGMIQT